MNKDALRTVSPGLRFYVLVISLLFSAGAYATEDACTKGFYAEISKELDKAYSEVGKPKINFSNLGIVKDMVVSRLEDRASSRPKGATFSINVMSDSISVVTFCNDKSTKGTWTPGK